jgi:hypothetical protein
MFNNKSITYKLTTGVQIVEDEFIAGYIVEKLDYTGKILSQYFSPKTKSQLIEDIKRQTGFKTKGQLLIDALLESKEDI